MIKLWIYLIRGEQGWRESFKTRKETASRIPSAVSSLRSVLSLSRQVLLGEVDGCAAQDLVLLFQQLDLVAGLA